jgi:hypothetical protein
MEDACEGEPIFLKTSNTFNISPQLKSGFFRPRPKTLGAIECGARISANPATYSWPLLLTAVWPPFWINFLDTTLISEPLHNGPLPSTVVDHLECAQPPIFSKKMTVNSPRCVPAFDASTNVIIPERESFHTTPSFYPRCSWLLSKIRCFGIILSHKYVLEDILG